MTYKELYESAIDKLEKSKITLGEFEEMIEPLNAEINTDSDTISRAKAIEALMNALNDVGVLDAEDINTVFQMLPPSQLGTNLAEVGTDTISRQAVKEILDKNQMPYHAYPYVWNAINALPPALPEPMKIDLSRCSEENWERFKKEWANIPITTIAAQPYTIIDGRLFITVDDIEQVDCVLVAEYKSKFCREFWMADADEPARPERIKGHWIESDAQNRLMKNFIEKGETWRVCDKCGAGFMIGYQYECDKLYHETFHNFCPKCGAEMEVTT